LNRDKFHKYLSLLITAISFISITALANTQPVQYTQAQKKLEQLEKSFDGKIGIYAIDINNNQIIAYRADERFPVQSTIKMQKAETIL